MNKKSLGRGLSSLLSDPSLGFDTYDGEESYQENNKLVKTKAYSVIPIESIVPNKEQPRKVFCQEELHELKESIKLKGLLQPIIVREKGKLFEIVAGERRWRASQLAQLHEIPAIIKDIKDSEVLEIAIIENIQRSNLNPYEEAMGYKELLEKFDYTQEELAKSLGKSRVYVANLVRLLNLPETVLEFVKNGSITSGHARALIGLENPLETVKFIVKHGISVRETEKIVRKLSHKSLKSKVTKKIKSSDTEILERDLSAELGLEVEILHNEDLGNGKLTLKYSTLEDLDTAISLLMKKSFNP